jgi:hypothetical protein
MAMLSSAVDTDPTPSFDRRLEPDPGYRPDCCKNILYGPESMRSRQSELYSYSVFRNASERPPAGSRLGSTVG